MTASAAPSVQLSVIVPLALGETIWLRLIDQLAALPTASEIIVVHADALAANVPQISGDTPVYHLTSLPGRARQQNAGARQARGRWLWFVHADSQLQPGTLPALQSFIAAPDDALGWFDLEFDRDGPRLAALNAWGANLRSRWLQLPFGDQALLLPAARFAQLDGFDESARLGEDHLLVWAAHRAGLPVRRIGAPIRTSARKYARSGWWRTTLRHWRLTLAQAWPAWRRLRRTPR
jgi:rSAM/selenodomain-associated transferase 2